MTTARAESRPPQIKRWSKPEYLRLIDRGAFDENGHFYLFRGELIDMSPMGSRHSVAIMKLTAVFARYVLPDHQFLRVQLPLDTPGDSIPEPDLAICSTLQAFTTPYPTSALLVIEVAESSLTHDRDKALEYAAAGVPEYGILDVVGRRLEIYRDPRPDPGAALGHRYAATITLSEHDAFAPSLFPHAAIRVADLLP